MQRMSEHIKLFAELMDRKGYDGIFLSSYGFKDRLKENLTKHVFQCFVEKKNIGPFTLSTYSKWTDPNNPHVRCDFYVKYGDVKGFEVMKMNVSYGNQYGTIRSKEIHLDNNSEFPEKNQANHMIQKSKGMKL